MVCDTAKVFDTRVFRAGLKLLDKLDELRYQDEEDLLLQCHVFDRQMKTDDDMCKTRDGVNLQDCSKLFTAVFNKVMHDVSLHLSMSLYLRSLYITDTVLFYIYTIIHHPWLTLWQVAKNLSTSYIKVRAVYSRRSYTAAQRMRD